MPLVVETGTWTAGGATPQTISLADGSLTPVAIICWMVRQGAAAAGFVASQALSIGFGTRRGGSTQSGCIGLWSSDAVATTSCGRVRNTTLLYVLSAETTTDYTVSLDSFAAGSFTVSYSSAAAASGDVFAYMVIGGLDDAIVLNEVMNSVGATEVVTGAGFMGNALLCLDASLNANNTPTSNIAVSFGCATSASRFWSVAVTETDGDTMVSNMNWNKAARTDACLERLNINADTSNARWDLDTFDADGFTLGVVDAPSAVDQIATFLILKGGAFEAGNKNKSAATGNDTFTLANGSLAVEGVILGCIRAVTGITTASADMMLGAGSTANPTRASAVNNTVGIVGPEAISTTADRFSATDSVIEELTGGASPAETSEAFFDTKSTGSFIIDWAVNGGSTNPVFYLAMGNQVVDPQPSAVYPDRLNPALALITAAHLAFATPTEPTVPTDQWAIYPDRLDGRHLRTDLQQFVAVGEQPAAPQTDQFVVYPDRLEGRHLLTDLQQFVAPGDLRTFETDQFVVYPDRLDGRHLRTDLQQFVALPGEPTVPTDQWVVYPDRLDGRHLLTDLQQFVAVGEQPAIPQTDQWAIYPDRLDAASLRTDLQQFIAVGEQPAAPQTDQWVIYPDRLDGRHLRTDLQQFTSFVELPLAPQTDQWAIYPDRLDGRHLLTDLQQFTSFVELPLLPQTDQWAIYPDSFPRPRFLVSEQLFEAPFAEVSPVPPIPPIPPTPPTPPTPPKPKKKKPRPVTFTSGGPVVGGIPPPFFLSEHVLEQLQKACASSPFEEICPAPIVLVEPQQNWRPPPAEQKPPLTYIDHVEQSVDQSHHFEDQSDRRTVTYNFGGKEDSTLRTVFLIVLGISLAAIIWSLARADAPLGPRSPEESPRRAPPPRRRAGAAARGRAR